MSNLNGTNIMLMGPAGTGKTYALGTLVDAGMEVFYVPLENGLESLLGYWTDKGQEIPKNLHWSETIVAQSSLADLLDSAKKANTLTLESLSKVNDPNRHKYNQFLQLLETLNNFKDSRTGEVYGAVNEWGTDRVIVLDGMSGVSRAAMSMVIGGKPVKSMADWGIAQTYVENLLNLLCDGCKCHFVLIAHVERETDQVLGGVKLMASTLGKALAPKIPSMFSDVILATREGTTFTWSTSSGIADLKTRNLPLADKIKPDFGQVIMKWKSRDNA